MKQLKAGQKCELKGPEWLKYREAVRRGITIGTIRYKKVKGTVWVTALDDLELIEETK